MQASTARHKDLTRTLCLVISLPPSLAFLAYNFLSFRLYLLVFSALLINSQPEAIWVWEREQERTKSRKTRKAKMAESSWAQGTSEQSYVFCLCVLGTLEWNVNFYCHATLCKWMYNVNLCPPGHGTFSNQMKPSLSFWHTSKKWRNVSQKKAVRRTSAVVDMWFSSMSVQALQKGKDTQLLRQKVLSKSKWNKRNNKNTACGSPLAY